MINTPSESKKMPYYEELALSLLEVFNFLNGRPHNLKMVEIHVPPIIKIRVES